MKFTRRKRIAAELLGPPLVGVLPFLLALLGSALWERLVRSGTNKSFLANLQFAATILVFAYLFVGIQSILYTAIMEWWFSRGLSPRGWRSVGLSSLLGLMSGAVVALAYGFERSDKFYLWLFWGGMGLVVGFIMGLMIKAWSTEKKIAAENPP